MTLIHPALEQPGLSNFGAYLRAGRNPTGGQFLGTFREAWQCENACLASAQTCQSFTFLSTGSPKVRVIVCV